MSAKIEFERSSERDFASRKENGSVRSGNAQKEGEKETGHMKTRGLSNGRSFMMGGDQDGVGLGDNLFGEIQKCVDDGGKVHE